MMPPYNSDYPEAKMLIEYRREFREISKKYMENATLNLPPPYLHDNLEDSGLDIETIKELFLDEDRRAVALESLDRAVDCAFPPDRLGYLEILVRAVFSPKTSVRDAFEMMEQELGIGDRSHLESGIGDQGENDKDWLCDWENRRLPSYEKGLPLY